MKIVKQWNYLVTFALLMGAALPVFAQSSLDTVLSATPTYAALFKNGVGLVASRLTLPNQEGEFQIAPLPEATFGSFWLHWGDGILPENIKATQIQSEKSVPAANIAELLEANIGKSVELWIKDRKEWQQYTILDIPKRHDDPILQSRPENTIPIPPPFERGEIVLLQGQTGREAIPISWVESIRHYTTDSVARPVQENAVQMTVKPGKSDGNRDVTLTYLAKGIAWSPSYMLDINQEKKATIVAKAIVVNDLQPLDRTNLELIAGYPNIAFSEANSTFSLTPLFQTLEKLRGEAGRGSQQYKFPVASNAVLTQRVAFDVDNDGFQNLPSMPATPVMGESAEDLYFYQIDDVTLKKGERGYYPLFSQEIPYEHVYTWEIPNYIDENAGYRGPQEQATPAQVVWHALKLTNTTPQPWTTAPAITMKDNRILGQDTLHYTAKSAATNLKITQAVAINAEQNEYEVDRQRSSAQFYSRNYDLVTVRGELEVLNYKEEPVTIEITKTLRGEVQKADGEPKISRLAKGLRSVNPDSQLVWKVEIKPGKDNALKLTYTYQVYIIG